MKKEELKKCEELDKKTENIVEDKFNENDSIQEDKNNNEVIDKSEEYMFEKNKNNKLPYIIMALIIIVLAAILYFVYVNMLNPKKMFIKSINKSYKEAEKYIDETFEYEINKPMIISNDLNLNININDSLIDDDTKTIIDEINKIKLNTTIGYDQKNQEMLMNIGTLYNDDSLIDVGTYAKNKKIYLELKNLFDKYIELPIENYDMYFEKNDVETEDIKYILSKTKDSFINNLEKNKFKKSKANIKLEGKNIKTTKISYSLSEYEMKKLTKNVFNELLKDSKFIESLATLSGQEKNKIKDILEEEINKLKEEIEENDFDEENKLSFIIYTKGFSNKVVGYEFNINSEESVISYYKGKIKDEIKILIDNEEIIKTSISDNKFVLESNIDDEKLKLEVLKKEKNKKTTYSYTIIASGMPINGEVVIEKIKENKDGTYEANISLSTSFMGMIDIKISGISKLEYNDKLEIPNLSNSISYDKLTEKDINSIQSKLIQNKKFVSLVTKINKYKNTSSTTK